MKKNFIISLFFLYPLYSQSSLAKDQCHIQEVTNLSVFKKNDYKLLGYRCLSEEGEYLKTYISNSVEKIFLNEYSDFAAKESPKTLAVSVYKPKLKRPPLIITINTSYYCCTPQLEGNLYKVNIYQINEKMKLTELTSLLGDKSEGFEGKAEGQVYYRFKNIYSIKKWLDKNYK